MSGRQLKLGTGDIEQEERNVRLKWKWGFIAHNLKIVVVVIITIINATNYYYYYYYY